MAIAASVLYFITGTLCIWRFFLIFNETNNKPSDGSPAYMEDEDDTLPTEIPAYLIANRSRNPR